MKKVILTVMSLAFLSSTANVFANGEKTVNVINNTDKDIILQNAVVQKDMPSGYSPSFRDIDTIKNGTTKSITFSKKTGNGSLINYKFKDIKNSIYGKSFDTWSIKGDITFNENK